MTHRSAARRLLNGAVAQPALTPMRTWSCALPIPPRKGLAPQAHIRSYSRSSTTARRAGMIGSMTRTSSLGVGSSTLAKTARSVSLRALHSATSPSSGSPSSSSRTASSPSPTPSRILLDANFFSSRRFSSLSSASASASSSLSGVTGSSPPPAVDVSSYAPTTDDPTSSVLGSLGSRVPISQPPIPKTPSEALALDYRPVVPPFSSTRALLRSYRSLSKSQLTFLIVLTSMAPYALVPSSLATSASVVTLLSLTAGTAMCSAAANAVNEMVESPYDAQMPRTRNRPLPSRQLTPLHAATFAVVTSAGGVTLLYTLVNPIVALLGGLNVFLYAFCYTPLKRLHIVNTWLGAIVGALPPLMGWSAATGTLLAPTDAPAWILASLLFAWQFPHFNSLAHNLRSEYARGGYRMMSVSHPSLNRRTSLRYAATLIPLCSLALPFSGVVVPIYSLLSLPPNLVLLRAAWRFYRERGMGGESAARKAFFASLIHLPTVLLLAMLCKTGFWVLEDVEGDEKGEGEKRSNAAEGKRYSYRWGMSFLGLGIPIEDWVR